VDEGFDPRYFLGLLVFFFGCAPSFEHRCSLGTISESTQSHTKIIGNVCLSLDRSSAIQFNSKYINWLRMATLHLV
jgi:hypothetical protein